MAHIGEQDDGTWVLGNDAFFSSDGRVIPAESSQYVWLGAMFRGTGVVSGHQQRCIQFPLSTDPLASLLHALHSSMAHNFYPCLLTMAGRYHFPIKSILTLGAHARGLLQLTLGAHAREGYVVCVCLVCLSVHLSVCSRSSCFSVSLNQQTTVLTGFS